MHAEDIEQPARLERGQRLGTDQPAVGNHAHAGDGEAPAEPVDDRDEGGNIGGVARPHLRAHRPAIAVDHYRQDHLAKIGPVILAVAVTAQPLAAGAFEVEASEALPQTDEAC